MSANWALPPTPDFNTWSANDEEIDTLARTAVSNWTSSVSELG